jgi:hypothetical protein
VEQELQDAVVGGRPAETAAAPATEPVPETPAAPDWLRFGLAIEFLLALIAVTVTWEEIGGQGDLDLMPWYVKLLLIGGVCWAFVRFTAALARPGKWRTRRSLGWLIAVLALLTAMGLTTYYYYLHAPPDDSDTDESPSTALGIPSQPPTGAHL